MSQQRVVITGIGAVSSLGASAQSTWDAINAGQSGIRSLDEYAGFPAQVFAPALMPTRKLDGMRKVASKLTLPMLLFCASVREAFEAAHLEELPDRGRVGIIAGTTANYPVDVDPEDLVVYAGCAEDHKIRWARFLRGHAYDPDHFFRHTTNLLTCLPALLFNLSGPNETLHNACASGTQTVGEAFRMIRHGRADAMIAGGAEALVNLAGATAMSKLGVLTPQTDPSLACRPFDRDRDGLVLGEGAAAIVVESLASAQARGVEVLAEIVGFGSTANAYRVTDSPLDGAAAAHSITLCLADAGIQPEEIDLISAHGTSTRQNDAAESNAVRRALGSVGESIPVCALKSVLGHALSAAGALEIAMGVRTLQTGFIPHVPTYRTRDAECPLNVVVGQPLRRPVELLLKNSFGFGGQNGSLLLRRWSTSQSAQ
jgi:3-oxoacyl-[acyl-carrier-protein] synthase II